MSDYRQPVMQAIDLLEGISVEGSRNCQRMYTAIYTLRAVVEDMQEQISAAIAAAKQEKTEDTEQ